MRGRTRAMVAAAFTSIALVASACGGGGTQNPPGGETGQTGGAIRIDGCTPKAALVPGNTSETCGGNMIDAMTAKLVHYNTENAAPENDIAESITASDQSKLFTVKLKKGYKFQDGTEVKAKNFVDAWNYTAADKNGQAGSAFYSSFAGYDDVKCGTKADGTADCAGKPAKTDKLSGLKVVDDYTFTIATSTSVSNLPVRLGYSAFAPLPDSFFADPKAFEDKPIGAGPFKLDSKSTTEFVFSKFADYSGANKPSIDKVTFVIYADPTTAYNDVVAGNLDYTEAIPNDRLIGDAYKTELPDRTLEKESGTISWITFMPTDPQLKDNPALRKAISRAIDRDTIVKQIFNGTRTPATGWVSPVVDGYKADACGDSCKYDPAAAKAAYTAAGGYKGTLTMTYNADGPHKDWSEAVCNSIKNALGVDCVAVGVVNFDTFQKKIDDGSLKGIIRSGWQMDYPSIENFLAPIYSAGSDSNWSKYKSPEFLKLLTDAAAASSVEEANGLYQKAEAQLATDFPTAPLWYGKAIVGWSDKVTDVNVNAFGVLDLTKIKTK